MYHSPKSGIGWIFFLILFVSCSDQKTYFSQSATIGEWPSQRVIHFKEIPASHGDELVARIEHSDQYGYENLYLKVSLSAKTETLLDTLINIPLMDDQGFWLGQKRKGSWVAEHKILELNQNEEQFEVRIEQFSRDQNLKGIQQMGILVRENAVSL